MTVDVDGRIARAVRAVDSDKAGVVGVTGAGDGAERPKGVTEVPAGGRALDADEAPDENAFDVDAADVDGLVVVVRPVVVGVNNRRTRDGTTDDGADAAFEGGWS
jgi:hypothetical protein